MARTINKLTARQVDALTEPGRYSDGGNLYLSVSPNGGRRWVFLYRYNGRQREMGLGSATKAGVSLARARELAAEARTRLGSGVDPLEARRADKAANQSVPSFGQWADAYVETHRKGWRNTKHADQWSMTLTRYCAAIRSMPVDAVDTEAVPTAYRVDPTVWVWSAMSPPGVGGGKKSGTFEARTAACSSHAKLRN